MSTYIDLNSSLRNRSQYPNPACYLVDTCQLTGWYRNARTVRATGQNPAARPLEFVTTIRPLTLTTPYQINDAGDTFADTPRLYLDFHSTRYNDVYLITSIGGVQKEAKFVFVQDAIQRNESGDPIWIHWRSDKMEQTMRFSRDNPVIFCLLDLCGEKIIIEDEENPNKPPLEDRQVFITFEVTPYVRDGDYDNHLISYNQQ